MLRLIRGAKTDKNALVKTFLVSGAFKILALPPQIDNLSFSLKLQRVTFTQGSQADFGNTRILKALIRVCSGDEE